jgi:hypothetical protein
MQRISEGYRRGVAETQYWADHLKKKQTKE